MRPARLLPLLSAAMLLPACAGTQMTPAEREIVDTMGAEAFQPATRELRDSIETQDLLTQASFWSREHRLNPSDLEATIKLASVVRRMGNPQRAIEITQATRALHPKDPYLLAEHAAALVAAERGTEALPLIEGGLREASGYARLWSLRGAALDQAERFAEARQSYGKALSITPYDPSILGNMGLSFALQGDYAAAEDWLQKATTLPGAPESVAQNLKLVQELRGQSAPSAQADARRAPAQLAAPHPRPATSPHASAQAPRPVQPFAPLPQAGRASTAQQPMAQSPAGMAPAYPGRNLQMSGPDNARHAAGTGYAAPVQAGDPDALNRLARNAASSGATVQAAPARSPFAPQGNPQLRPQVHPQGYATVPPQGYPAPAHSPAPPPPQFPAGYPQPYPQAQVQVTPRPVPPQTAQRMLPPRGPARPRR